MRHVTASALSALLVSLYGAGSAGGLEPGQSPPLSVYSIGDSLTRATNANLPGDNLSASWVNGYRGFWQELFGLPNVGSHNQRISAMFGDAGRQNWIAAHNGARVDDIIDQAPGAIFVGASYVTVFMGGNDVCRDSPLDLPTDAEFEANVRTGLTTLVSGLSMGATVLVAALPNVKALFDVGQSKTALWITNCPTLWDLTGFCGAMLSRASTEVDRQYLETRNVGYNRILEIVSGELAAQYPGKFVRYAPGTYLLPAEQSQISDIDCFHLSWQGQRSASELTWPF